MKKTTLCSLFFVLALAVGCSHSAVAKEAATPSSAEKGESAKNSPSSLVAVDKVQAAWDEAKTFRSSFKQIVFSKGLGTREQTEGTLYVSKPDQLRWEANDGSLQVLAKDVLWVVQPNRRRGGRIVDKWKKASSAVNAQLLNFIAGKSKLKELYNISTLPPEGDLLVFRFTSKGTDGESLIAKVDKKSYLLRSLTSESMDSRILMELGKVETNVSLKNSLFKFVPKKDDIIHEN